MATNQIILNQIRRRKELFGVSTQRPKRTPKWLFPVLVENEYKKALLSFVKYIQQQTNILVVPHLEALSLEAKFTQQQGGRGDGWVDSANVMLENLKISVEKESAVQALPLAENIGAKTAAWNDKEWRKILKSTFGINIFTHEPWLIDELKTFAAQNVTLIKSLEVDTLKNIEGVVQRGIQTGRRHEEIAKDLNGIKKGVFKKSRTRAKLIARDQVAKLNGNLTRLRQTNLGVEKYRWQDSADNRVRTTHLANDGKIFSWDKPPFATGHPGQDVQCRCWAEPIFPDEFFNQVGA